MIKAAQEQIDWINCSATHIPIRPGSVDLVISIATLHHIPKHLVNAALRGGIHESLSPGGGLFVATVWGGCNEATLRRLRRINDCEGYINWSYGLNESITRYYRLYKNDELKNEALNAGFTIIRNGTIRLGKFINYYIVSHK